jgi:hypothetical protein
VRLRSAARDVVSFERVLGSDDLPFLADHQVNGRAILPATGFIEMALATGRQVWGSLPGLQDVVISEPLAFAPGETRTVQVLVRQAAPGQGTFEVLSQGEDEGEDDTWHLHVQGAYAAMTPPNPLEAVNAVLARCTEALDGATHYARLDERHLTFGPSLQGVRRIHRCDGEGLGEIALPASAGAGDYVLHPALLDACLQVMAAALPESTATGKAYLPMSIEQIQVHRSPPADVSSHVRVQASGRTGSDTLKASVTVFDAQGLVATLEGIALRAAAGAALPFYEITWQPETGAAWLPTPAQLAAQAGPLLDGLAREHKLDDYQQAFLSLEAMSAAWIVRALAELGWAPRLGDRVQADALSLQLGVAARYHRLMPRLLAILAEDGLLRADACGWTVLSWPSLADPMAEVAALVQRHPACARASRSPPSAARCWAASCAARSTRCTACSPTARPNWPRRSTAMPPRRAPTTSWCAKRWLWRCATCPQASACAFSKWVAARGAPPPGSHPRCPPTVASTCSPTSGRSWWRGHAKNSPRTASCASRRWTWSRIWPRKAWASAVSTS